MLQAVAVLTAPVSQTLDATSRAFASGDVSVSQSNGLASGIPTTSGTESLAFNALGQSGFSNIVTAEEAAAKSSTGQPIALDGTTAEAASSAGTGSVQGSEGSKGSEGSRGAQGSGGSVSNPVTSPGQGLAELVHGSGTTAPVAVPATTPNGSNHLQARGEKQATRSAAPGEPNPASAVKGNTQSKAEKAQPSQIVSTSPAPALPNTAPLDDLSKKSAKDSADAIGKAHLASQSSLADGSGSPPASSSKKGGIDAIIASANTATPPTQTGDRINGRSSPVAANPVSASTNNSPTTDAVPSLAPANANPFSFAGAAQGTGAAAPAETRTAVSPQGSGVHTGDAAAPNASGLTPQNVLPSVANARLMQSLSGSTMQVNLRSEDFGRVSVHTAFGRESIAAQISVENSQLGSALGALLNAHASTIEQRLGQEHGLQASVTIDSHTGSELPTGSGQRGSEQEPSRQSPNTLYRTTPTSPGLPSSLSSAGTPLFLNSAGNTRLDIRI